MADSGYIYPIGTPLDDWDALGRMIDPDVADFGVAKQWIAFCIKEHQTLCQFVQGTGEVTTGFIHCSSKRIVRGRTESMK
jgi:hypothetical protein